ncbi:MAG: hypothetical protein AB7S92_23060 [Parvibaculaceae bacterium]
MASPKARQPTRGRFPEGFAKVRLRLAREPDHPQGSQEHGYDLVVPLKENGRIDGELWKSHRDLCRVVHYRAGEEHDLGHMVRAPGGQWKFHYDIRGDEADPRGYRFADERFVVGEYISVTEGDGPHTYRVVTIERL